MMNSKSSFNSEGDCQLVQHEVLCSAAQQYDVLEFLGPQDRRVFLDFLAEAHADAGSGAPHQSERSTEP